MDREAKRAPTWSSGHLNLFTPLLLEALDESILATIGESGSDGQWLVGRVNQRALDASSGAPAPISPLTVMSLRGAWTSSLAVALMLSPVCHIKILDSRDNLRRKIDVMNELGMRRFAAVEQGLQCIARRMGFGYRE